jgi:hypothetical protein
MELATAKRLILLDIPAEIRLRIWKLLIWDLLEDDETCLVKTNARFLQLTVDNDGTRKFRELFVSNTPNPSQDPKGSPLQFLQTCRQIYHEAIRLVYEQVTFVIEPPLWRRQVSSRGSFYRGYKTDAACQVELIRRLQICQPCGFAGVTATASRLAPLH